VPIHPERKSLLIARGIDHQRASAIDVVGNPVPHQFPDARRDMPDENTRCDLEQPPREVPPQPGRHRGQDDDGQNSTSYPTPPGTVRSPPSHNDNGASPMSASASSSGRPSRSSWMSRAHRSSSFPS